MPDTPTIDTTQNVSGLGLQLGQAAAGVGGDAISAILGMAMQKHNNKVQLEQQKKLTQLQLAAEQEMSKFNYAQQYQMWKNTNYGAQVDELNNAGLNPALLYAKGGAGGQLGSGSGGAGIGAGTAGTGGEIMALMGAKQNLATQAAQTELLKAQTNATNVHAQKEAGADTENVKADTAQKNQAIENLKTEIKNTQANTALTKVQTALTAIQKDITEATTLDQIKITSLNAATIQQQLLQLQNQTDISNATKNTTIQTIKQQYTNTVIEAVLMKSARRPKSRN